MLATVSHGSPFVYLRVNSGDLNLQLAPDLQASVQA